MSSPRRSPRDRLARCLSSRIRCRLRERLGDFLRAWKIEMIGFAANDTCGAPSLASPSMADLDLNLRKAPERRPSNHSGAAGEAPPTIIVLTTTLFPSSKPRLERGADFSRQVHALGGKGRSVDSARRQISRDARTREVAVARRNAKRSKSLCRSRADFPRLMLPHRGRRYVEFRPKLI